MQHEAFALHYPESDGQPMADNTEQFDWIVVIKLGLEALFADNPTVFIAGDLLWYPIEGDNKIRIAPDVLVAFGRPKGKRGSYQQWLENHQPPHVVFEILSPGNTVPEMTRKFGFYERYGVEEYYLFDPGVGDLSGWLRSEGRLEPIPDMQGWVSPRLGIRFEMQAEGLKIYRPDGQPFETYTALAQRAAAEAARATKAEAELEQLRAELERLRAVKD
jgi:Uma2 family endonuclease